MALALANELEGDAIHAAAAPLWESYGVALERTIRLAESELSAQEILWQLAAAITTIYPPEGGA